MNVKETYNATALAANATHTFTSQQMGGFLCTVAGSLTLTAAGGTVLVSALPVSAGIYYPLPIHFNRPGATLVLSGGAAGTVFA